MKHFILLSFGGQSLIETLVVIDLGQDLAFSIESTDFLVFDFYHVELVLVDQLGILCLSDHSFTAWLNTFPLLVLDHCTIGTHVLTLERDLF